jgi:hypothetical protein
LLLWFPLSDCATNRDLPYRVPLPLLLSSLRLPFSGCGPRLKRREQAQTPPPANAKTQNKVLTPQDGIPIAAS